MSFAVISSQVVLAQQGGMPSPGQLIILLILAIVVLVLLLVAIALGATTLFSLFTFIGYRIARGLDRNYRASLISPPPVFPRNELDPPAPFQVQLIARGILLGIAAALLLLGLGSIASPWFIAGGGIAAAVPLMEIQQEENIAALFINITCTGALGVMAFLGSLITFGFASGAFARSRRPPIQVNSRP